ncbi:MAG: molybdopterin-dependent oxidoreductase [Planctomycetota bacterium]
MRGRLLMDRRDLMRYAAAAGPVLAFGRAAFGAEDAADGGGMNVHGRVPPNAEPPLGRLVDHWITPTEWFYVRSHAPTPNIDAASFRLTVDGLVDKPLNLSLDELKSEFTAEHRAATMTCAGNRRNEHSLVKQVKGVPWGAGAIGNALWTGAPLREVLERAGVRAGAKHVCFEGLDAVPRPDGVIPFGASIPLEKAMAPASAGEPLLAWAMNEEPLTPDHGFPLRTVVPGYIGARSVKWIGRVTVTDRPSSNHFVATAYKTVTEDTAEAWSAESPIQTNVLNSVTCSVSVSTNEAGDRRYLEAVGYALPSGLPGARVTKVEVSIDGGQTWDAAGIRNRGQDYCWVQWYVKARLWGRADQREVVVRATDSTGATQPEEVPWNLKGYLFNAWHRTPVALG